MWSKNWFNGVMVSEGSARYEAYLYTVDADHFTICKPIEENSPSFKILLQFIQHILEDQEKSMEAELESFRIKFFVGLQPWVEKIQATLETVSTLGLYGMGGVGKTTLAKEFYEKFHKNFDYSCWISDFKRLWQTESRQRLKYCMLEDLKCRGKRMNLEDKDWNLLRRQKVLLIVDNVDADHLLEEIPSKGWFAEGSKVIITSREQRFCQKRFEKAIEVEFLTDTQSLELFLHHAFEGDQPPFRVMKQVDNVLRFCAGVPLAIETIASTLRKEMNTGIWESVIQKLKEGEPADGKKDNRLLNTLKVSYDGFQREEQKMFLDSTLLFKGKPISEALSTWKTSWGIGVRGSLGNPISGCLVDVKNHEIWVHETLCMLTQNIACPKHDEEWLCNWSRVCKAPDARKLLKDVSQKPCKAEVLLYEPRQNNGPALVLPGGRISEARFPHLQFLTLTSVQIEGDAICPSARLTHLKWSHTSQTTFPFVLRNLTDLCWLELIGCRRLQIFPKDVDSLVTLSRLELEGCSSLISLPTEIQMLTALKYLGVANSGLRELPESLGNLLDLEMLVLRGSRVLKLPDSVGKLKKLRVIQAEEIPLTELPSSLLNCLSITRIHLRGALLTRLPESFGSMRNLQDLDLSRTKLEMLPYSFTSLGELLVLNLKSTPLRYLPEHIGKLQSLEWLDMTDTPLEELPASITKLGNLEILLMMGCNKLACLPDGFENLRRLQQLHFSNSKQWAISGNLLRESLTNLHLNYDSSLFDAHDAHGSTIDAIVLQESEQGRLSASMSDHSEGGKDDVVQFRPYKTPLGVSRGSCDPGEEVVQSIRFERLKWLTVIGNTNLVEFPLPLLYALPHMKELSSLTLFEFHAVNRLPENFGDFLPRSLDYLLLEGWRSLEELPESLGRVPTLYRLGLKCLDSLTSLPETLPDWPELRTIHVGACESLHGWPSRGLGKRVTCIDIDSWALMSELVEKHDHLAPLVVRCLVKREDVEGVEAALRAWGREPPSSLSLSFSSFSIKRGGVQGRASGGGDGGVEVFLRRRQNWCL